MGQVSVNGYQNYITKDGDAYDALAIDAYDDEMMASHIIQANPRHMETLIFEAGVSLRIPVLENVERPESLPPWRR